MTTSPDCSPTTAGSPRTRRKRHRILFTITSSDIGGSENILRELVQRLDRELFEPVVCSLRAPGRIAGEIAAAGIPVCTLEMSDRVRFFELAAGVHRLARQIDEMQIDLVHSFLYRANVVSRLAARLSRRRPLVVSSQRSLRPTGDRMSAMASRLTQRMSDRILAVSEAVRAEVIKDERLAPERVVVIGNGVDVSRYDTTPPAAAQRELRASPGSMLVGGVGRFSPEKGFADLLQAVALARAEGAAIELLLVGSGPESTQLQQQAKSLGLNGHVRFAGARRDLRDVYAAFDVFALPSHQEGAPNTLLEAMASSRPVVATSVGGVPELVEDEISALLVEPRSPRALARALARLAADGDLRGRLGRAALDRVKDRFDVSVMVAQHARLYTEMLAGGD